MIAGQPSALEFFGRLNWIDGRPLLDTIEPYRRETFTTVLDTPGDDGGPLYNLALVGRGKKNWKTADLVLAGLFRFVAWKSPQGNDAFILANDEDQASDDLSLLKKLVAANPALASEILVQVKELVRRDGAGTMRILPSRDVAGQHGKTALFVGFDEIWAYRNHDLFEALAPDPTRDDALIWITSYQGLRQAPGIPIHDYFEAGKRGDDPRMHFSWYAGDYTTDPSVPEDATPEVRANPSMASWGNDKYLAQQKRRLPTHKYRRLHLNLPGAPDGAFFDQGAVLDAIVTGRKSMPPAAHMRYVAFVDMSGGSNDDACLGIAFANGPTSVLAHLCSQAGKPPFNPRDAVAKFAGIMAEFGCTTVVGDAYAGQTFRRDFEGFGIHYQVCKLLSASELYEAFEPRLNAGEVELLDIPKLQEQLLTLVLKGSKITHQPGDHDDWATAACGACWLANQASVGGPIPNADAVLARLRSEGPRRWDEPTGEVRHWTFAPKTKADFEQLAPELLLPSTPRRPPSSSQPWPGWMNRKDQSN